MCSCLYQTHTFLELLTTALITHVSDYCLARLCQLQNLISMRYMQQQTEMPTITLEVGAYFVSRTFPEAMVPVLRGPGRVTGAVTAL